MTIKSYRFWKEVKMMAIIIPLGIALGLIAIKLIEKYNLVL